ncbi:hypothetical protein L873DRAFT_1853868 [Choiromyces venosus 120613-1]|uniref:Uncharacterized protein n=1 Tax=Choiromyces venosus 120613-1 TaxID=1336337 RepID=A0A3N4J7W5_9PEZI|nr:hypothetical protein L873DRAFT_1853868 [Choiromyces venosus 120613-1]
MEKRGAHEKAEHKEYERRRRQRHLQQGWIHLSDLVTSDTNIDPKRLAHLAHPEDYTNCRTNPKHGPGGIADAQLEGVAGKIVKAWSLIAPGCDYCLKTEDVWLEAMQLNEPSNTKIKVADSVRHNHQSFKLWVEGIELEKELKALDIIPHSVVLWKESIKLKDDPADAKTLITRVVQLVPLSIELRLTQNTLKPLKMYRYSSTKRTRLSVQVWKSELLQ